jgi:hypothetical protein
MRATGRGVELAGDESGSGVHGAHRCEWEPVRARVAEDPGDVEANLLFMSVRGCDVKYKIVTLPPIGRRR